MGARRACALVACALASGCGVGLAAAVPAARAMTAVPVARVADADALGRTAFEGLAASQRPDGLWDDPVGRVVGGSGLPTLAWVALHQLRHADGGAELRRTAAAQTLAHGSGASVILNWPLAMAVAMDLDMALPDMRDDLRRRVLRWTAGHAAGIADRCFKNPACFNNYKVADAVLNLELARSGLRSDVAGARLADPDGLRARTLTWLGSGLVGAARSTGLLVLPGRPAQRTAILSDPEAYPLAYQALCTAWAVRAVVLAGPAAPAGLRVVVRRALWTLVALTAPDGELSWSGRGQGQAWTLSAVLYAAAAGSRVYADTDPQLAARLRRLADIELVALRGRLTGGVLQVVPAGNADTSGLDHYYSVAGSTALALTWLEMARDELPDPAAPRLRIGSEIDRATFADGATTGIVTRRVGRLWLALRMRQDHRRDPRQDFGLVRALRLDPGGWRELRPLRPGPLSSPTAAARRVPTGGPALIRRGIVMRPRATGWRVVPRGIELTGSWHVAGNGTIPARWRFTAVDGGVTLRSTCPARTRLRFTEWLPRAGRLVRARATVRRGPWRVTFSRPVQTRALPDVYANARQGSLRAWQIGVGCRTRTLTARWTGGATALP